MRNIIAIILLVGAIGLFFGYTNKKYQDIKAARADVEEYQKALDQSKDILAKRGDLQKKYNNFKEVDRQALERLLPDYIDNVKLVLDMNSIAKRYGMSLKGIKMDEEKSDKAGSLSSSKKDYGSLAVTFTVTASYENFQRFLRDLERSLRIVDVTALSFRSADTGLYDYSVTLKTYWLNK